MTENDSLAPIAPFWFWNGEMKEDEIIGQIAAMDDAGVRGFIVCARQGLKVPYLSDRWFKLVRLASDEAKRRGMDVWLYDEQPYPSLAGGGRVALDHPEFEAKELSFRRETVDRGLSLRLNLGWGEVLSAVAFPESAGLAASADWEHPVDISRCVGQLFEEEVFHETGLTAFNRKRFLACSPYLRLDWTAPENGPERWIVFVFCQIPVRGHKYYDRFVDPLNPAAVDYFLKITHDRYAEEYGSDFTSSIKGIFTDEIHPTGFEGAGIPWSPKMIELFDSRWKESLTPLFPGLVDDGFPDHARIRYRFMTTLVDAFIESYDKRVSAWCKGHGIRFIGEKPILRSEQLRWFDIPGIDTGHQKTGAEPETHPARYRANPRILASAAHFYGKRRCLCESFHSIGWGMDLQDMKWTYDWLALQGVNLFVNHAYYYTTANLTKHDAPPSEFIQMPWWEQQGLLSAYVNDLVERTKSANRRPRILVVDVVSSAWTAAFGAPELRELRGELFAATQRTLFDHHFDFWVIDPRLLATAGVSGSVLTVGNESFECLIIPPTSNLEDGAYAAAERLLEGTGALVCCGPPPTESISGVSVEKLSMLWNRAKNVLDLKDLPTALERLGLRDFSVHQQGQEREDTDMHAMLYRTDDGARGFLLNPYGRTKTVDFTVFLREGEISRTLELGPFESTFVDFTRSERDENEIPRSSGDQRSCLSIDPSKTLSLEIEDPNALRLDSWDMTISCDDRSATIRAMPIVDQLAAGNFRLPARRNDRFGTPKTLLFPPLSATYTAYFQARGVFAPIDLRIEPDSIGGLKEIMFNGRLLDIAQKTLVRSRGIDEEVFALGVPEEGRNSISITVDAKVSGDGLRSPPHVTGWFAVEQIEPAPAIIAQKKNGCPLDRRSSGLPHFAGSIVYSGILEVDPESPRPTAVRIENPDWRSACGLSVNGVDLGTKAWHPFKWTIPDDMELDRSVRFELREYTNRLGYFENQYFDTKTVSYGDFT